MMAVRIPYKDTAFPFRRSLSSSHVAKNPQAHVHQSFCADHVLKIFSASSAVSRLGGVSCPLAQSGMPKEAVQGSQVGSRLRYATRARQ